MDDVLALDISLARPRHVLMTRCQRCTDRVYAGDEETILAQHVQHRAAHAGHDAHIDHNIRAVGDFNADLGDGRTQRTHAERNNVHSATAHATVEQAVQRGAHFRWRCPVVGRASIFLVDRANKSAVFNPADVGGVRTC